MPSSAEHKSSEPRTEFASGYVAGLPEEDRLLWLSMPQVRRARAYSRLDAVLAVEAAGRRPSDVARAVGIKPGRFYQILRSWKAAPGRPASLGIGVTGGAGGGPPIAANAKARSLELMREALASGRPVRTEAVLRRVEEAIGDAASRKSLLRWWTAERRAAPAGRVGSTISLDFCALDLARGDGRLHAAAFIVDKGTGVVLGAALSTNGSLDALLFATAARDALARLPALGLERLEGAPRMRSLTVATGAEPMSSLHLLSVLEVAKSVSREMSDARLLGRATSRALGGRLGQIGLLPGAVEAGFPREAGERVPRIAPSEVEELIRYGMDGHCRAVSMRNAVAAPGDRGRDAVRRLRGLMERLALCDGGADQAVGGSSGTL